MEQRKCCWCGENANYPITVVGKKIFCSPQCAEHAKGRETIKKLDGSDPTSDDSLAGTTLIKIYDLPSLNLLSERKIQFLKNGRRIKDTICHSFFFDQYQDSQGMQHFKVTLNEVDFETAEEYLRCPPEGAFIFRLRRDQDHHIPDFYLVKNALPLFFQGRNVFCSIPISEVPNLKLTSRYDVSCNSVFIGNEPVLQFKRENTDENLKIVLCFLDRIGLDVRPYFYIEDIDSYDLRRSWIHCPPNDLQFVTHLLSHATIPCTVVPPSQGYTRFTVYPSVED